MKIVTSLILTFLFFVCVPVRSRAEITNLTFAAKVLSYDQESVVVEFAGGKKLKVKRSLFKAKKLAAGDAALVSAQQPDDINDVMTRMARITK